MRTLRMSALSAVLAAGVPSVARAELRWLTPDELGPYGVAGLAVLILLVLLLLLLRPIVCWYLKIGERTSTLEEIRDTLTEIASKLDREREARRSQTADPETVCPQCRTRYPGDLRGRFCDKCGARL